MPITGAISRASRAGYHKPMVVHISDALEHLLQDLASKSGRSPDDIAEDAIRMYAEISDYGDLTSEQVAETQMKIMPELGIEPWGDADAPG